MARESDTVNQGGDRSEHGGTGNGDKHRKKRNGYIYREGHAPDSAPLNQRLLEPLTRQMEKYQNQNNSETY